jgi:predicted unusual protein kinase regulating ubiquinone biosynthesis (AarF/ABC1/UbiB family)
MQADRLLPEFERTIRAELDHAAEAADVELFHHHFADDAGMAIPEVIRDRTAGDVLCETRLTGAAVADAASAATDAKAR